MLDCGGDDASLGERRRGVVMPRGAAARTVRDHDQRQACAGDRPTDRHDLLERPKTMRFGRRIAWIPNSNLERLVFRIRYRDLLETDCPGDPWCPQQNQTADDD